jgi:aspartate racemase
MTSRDEKSIIIGGGAGPAAGVLLHRYIVENTRTDGTDQDHISVYHISRPGDMSDRTEYLTDEEAENPSEGMLRSVLSMEGLIRNSNHAFVMGIPCITFHAPRIWDGFLRRLDEARLNIRVVNMLEEIGRFLRRSLPDSRSVGVLSTTGSRSAKLFDPVVSECGMTLKEIPENLQDELHDTIYNRTWGLKATSGVDGRARKNIDRYLDILRAEGAGAVILGCTELSMAFTDPDQDGLALVDPVRILARALIDEANPMKLKAVGG